jgi:glutathione S-transferase
MPPSTTTIRLWGRNNSINVQKVMWTCEELGIGYERVDAGGAFGGTDTDDYLAMNPNGLVPVIRDGEQVIWESNAIIRYLFARYAPDSGTGLHYPTDARVRALEEQWMDWQATDFWPGMRPIFKGLIRKEDGIDATDIARATHASEARLAILNGQLEKAAFVAGKRFSMADIPVGLTVARWLKLPVDHKRHQHVESWFDAIRSRPAFRSVDIPLT